MEALLLAFTMWFIPPEPGDLVIIADGKPIAVIGEFTEIQVVRWDRALGREPEELCRATSRDRGFKRGSMR